MELEQIPRDNVADAVIRQLLNRMLDGRLKPGGKLPTENEMAAQIGVGRNSIREALKVLQALGFVVRRQGSGSYIAESYEMPFDWLLFPLVSRIGTSKDLVELRLALELGVTEIVIEKAGEKDFAVLEQRIADFEMHGKKGTERAETLDIDAAVRDDVRLHLALAELTGNAALIALARLVMKLFELSMRAHLSSADGYSTAKRDHRAFCDAIRSRDRDEARRKIIRSFEHWKTYIDLPNPN